MQHIQQGVPGWLESVSRLLTAKTTVKTFQVQQLSEVKSVNPNLLTLHRHWNDPFQIVNSNDTEAIREQRAREWFNQFIDGTFLNGSTAGINHAAATDMISWWNEYYANSQSPEEKQLWILQERAAARVWMNEYRNGPNSDKLGHIRLSIAATAVGNDIPLETAETASLYDCVVDYHPYDHWINGNRDSGSWQWYSGRWNAMDAQFRSAGYFVDWVFGEAGPYSSPVEGWKASDVCGGDISCYVDAVKWFIQQCAQTQAYQEGRTLGFCLFTTGGGGSSGVLEESYKSRPILPENLGATYTPPMTMGRIRKNKVQESLVSGGTWDLFETKSDALNPLADMTAIEWNPGDNVPTPPPPTEPPEVDYTVVVNLLHPEATMEQKLYVLQQVHESRQTILQSADDAYRLVVPARADSKVKVWHKDGWKDDIVAWLHGHGVNNVEEHEYQ